MKKLVIIPSLIIISWWIVCFLVTSNLEKQIEQKNSKIGQEFILNKDTFIIIDYSSWEDTYTLNNGLEVNAKMIK